MPNSYIEIQVRIFTGDTSDLIRSIIRHYECLCEKNNFQYNFIDIEFFDDNSEHWKSIVLKINSIATFEFLSSDINNLPSIIFEFVSVTIYPEIDTDAIFIAESEITIEYFRIRNAVDCSMIHHTDCCVKLIHIPSGTIVRCQDYRSRIKNYTEALRFLKSKVFRG